MQVTAKAVAKAMIDKEFTQEQLAEHSGISGAAVSKLIRTGAGSLDLKQRVAAALDRPFPELFPTEAKTLAETLATGAPVTVHEAAG